MTLIVLGLIYAFAIEGSYRWWVFSGFLFGTVWGWAACKVHYKVTELQKDVEQLRDDVYDLQAEVRLPEGART